MNDLHCRGLATSLLYENNGPRQPRSGLTPTHIVGYALQLLFYKRLCKAHGLARRDFLASGDQPEVRFFSNIHENQQISFYERNWFLNEIGYLSKDKL